MATAVTKVTQQTPSSVQISVAGGGDAESWLEFLKLHHAIFDEEGVAGFDRDPMTEADRALNGDIIVDLSHYGIIEVSGDDRISFLNGLFTSDVRQLTPDCSQFSSWCDAKGRVLATFWLIQRDKVVNIVLLRSILPGILAKLRMYVLRAKVKLIDVSTNTVRIGLSGKDAAPRLGRLLGVEVPSVPGATVRAKGCTLIRISDESQWLVLGSCEAVLGLWLRLIPEALPVGRQAWSLLNIVHHLPDVVAATAGKSLPQMLGMEEHGGVSFNKGCYPGQEHIARLKYRGQLTRTLNVAYIENLPTVAPGTPLYRAEAGAGNESIGHVMAAACHPDGQLALLCVLQTEAVGANVFLETPTAKVRQPLFFKA